MGVDYYSYIQSDEWRQRANAAKQRAGYRCQVCNRPSRDVILDAHHRTYERSGNETPDDITVLCRDCHELYELHGRPPKRPSKQKTIGERLQTYTPPVAQRPFVKTESPISYSNSGAYSTVSTVPSRLSTTVTINPADAAILRINQRQKSFGTLQAVVIGALALVAMVFLIRFNAESSSSKQPPTLAIVTTSLPTRAPTALIEPTSTLPPTIKGATRTYVAVIVAGAEMRTGPSISYRVVGTWVRGARVAIAGYTVCENATWYWIAQDRWINSELVNQLQTDVPYISTVCPSNSPAYTSSKNAISSVYENSPTDLAATLTSIAGPVRVEQTPAAIVAPTETSAPTRTPQPTSAPTLTARPTATSRPPTATPRPVTPTDTPRPIQPTAAPAARGCPGGCTTYPTWCEVVIKGNVSYNTGERIYHVPGQEYYSDTVINTQYGERWFCTEQEARAAGWRKSRQ